MPDITKRAAAKSDLIEDFVYLAENASVDVADRFLANAEASFNALSQQPSMGAPLTLRLPDLIGMRKWRVVDFDNVLQVTVSAGICMQQAHKLDMLECCLDQLARYVPVRAPRSNLNGSRFRASSKD